MNAEDNSSTWRVNGRDARMKDVEELVRDKLKIQLDNLCQVGGCWSVVLHLMGAVTRPHAG